MAVALRSTAAELLGALPQRAHLALRSPRATRTLAAFQRRLGRRTWLNVPVHYIHSGHGDGDDAGVVGYGGVVDPWNPIPCWPRRCRRLMIRPRARSTGLPSCADGNRMDGSSRTVVRDYPAVLTLGGRSSSPVRGTTGRRVGLARSLRMRSAIAVWVSALEPKTTCDHNRALASQWTAARDGPVKPGARHASGIDALLLCARAAGPARWATC